MKKGLVFLVLMMFGLVGFAQQKTYFQQEVDYKIEVTLNDQKHEIYGDIEITYKIDNLC